MVINIFSYLHTIILTSKVPQRITLFIVHPSAILCFCWCHMYIHLESLHTSFTLTTQLECYPTPDQESLHTTSSLTRTSLNSSNTSTQMDSSMRSKFVRYSNQVCLHTTSSLTRTSLNSSNTSTQMDSSMRSKFVFSRCLFRVSRLLSRYFIRSSTAYSKIQTGSAGYCPGTSSGRPLPTVKYKQGQQVTVQVLHQVVHCLQ